MKIFILWTRIQFEKTDIWSQTWWIRWLIKPRFSYADEIDFCEWLINSSEINSSMWSCGNKVAKMVKNLLEIQESWVQSLGQEDPLEKGMATHSRILAWRIPRTKESGRGSLWGCKESDTAKWLTHRECTKILYTDSSHMPRMFLGSKLTFFFSLIN